jgi:hypothetical protein
LWRNVVNVSGISVKMDVEEPLPLNAWAGVAVTISGELPGELEEEEENAQ